MEYKVIKIAIGNGTDPTNCICAAPIGEVFSFGVDCSTKDINKAYKKVSSYNDLRQICGCKLEVQEVKQ